MSVEIPEWRIIDDATWFAVSEIFARNAAEFAESGRKFGPGTRYALTGIGRCAHCGGSIGALSSKGAGGVSFPVYGCERHNRGGNTACPIRTRRPVSLCERTLSQFLTQKILTKKVEQEVLADVRSSLERTLGAAKLGVSVAEIDAELAKLKTEQRTLAAAVATSGEEIPELLSELRKRSERIRTLERDRRSAERTPAAIEALVATAMARASARLSDGKTLLAEPSSARSVFLELFPEGLRFEEQDCGPRRTWAITGMAQVGSFALQSDPRGT